jgi:hypothetical protein
MPATRLLDRGRHGEKSWDNASEETLVYHVADILPSNVDWGVDGLPNRGEPHPDAPIPPMFARRLRKSEFGDQRGTLVEITFSNSDAAYRGTSPAVPIGSEFIWGMTYRDDVWPMPYAVFTEVALNDGTGNVTGLWATKTRDLRESRAGITARWQLVNPGFPEWFAMFNQHNKIHTFSGRQYLFQAGGLTIRSLNDKVYEVSGTWIFDPGTPNIFSSDPDLVRMPGDLSYIGIPPQAGFIRDPYHQLIVAPELPGFDGQAPMRLMQVRVYDEEPLGWQELPSIPNID